ncbi:MAG: SMP-30/gluconolactonase/LRE family protein [Bacteroidota bacterium]|nr:SMP-30/gluconolactonase/LRE family protein [Bacteroidota bacterium]
MNLTKNIMIIAALFVCSCHSQNDNSEKDKNVQKDNPIGKIEIYDKSALPLIDSNATIEVIARGFNWAEGPVWIAEKNSLLFSNVPENKIYQWAQGDSTSVYLRNSGYTGTKERKGEIGSNGLTLDKNGRLLICQSGNRQVVRMNAGLNKPKADYTVLAASYNGKKFNSPNDLACDSKGNIYFTDPTYGLPQGDTDPERELNFEGVYKIDIDGKLTLLTDSIPKPNGIALSLDEKKLYVASSDNKKPKWYVYDLDANGNLKDGHVLFDAAPLKEKATVKQGPDGFKIDKYGNLFAAGPDGINIISPGGKLLGLIKIYDRKTSNCAFNESKDVLYITAADVILKVVLHS